MLDAYALQIAAYCGMATNHLGQAVSPGGLIRTAGYLARDVPAAEPPGVFFAILWTLPDCRNLLDGIRLLVAIIRRGEIVPSWVSLCGNPPRSRPSRLLTEMDRDTELQIKCICALDRDTEAAHTAIS
jgi:hypothetical protein